MRAKALAWAKPRRYFVLTRAPVEWQRLRWRMHALRRDLMHAGYGWKVAWTVELTKRGVPHVNVLQHGDFVPQRELQRRWGSIVHAQEINGAEQVGAYSLKVARYSMKESSGGMTSYLELNGGRLSHHSRDYFHGRTLESVENEVRAEEGHTWLLVGDVDAVR